MCIQGENGFAGGDNFKLISKSESLFDPRVKDWASLTLVELQQLVSIKTRVNSSGCVSNHCRAKKCGEGNVGMVLQLSCHSETSPSLHLHQHSARAVAIVAAAAAAGKKGSADPCA